MLQKRVIHASIHPMPKMALAMSSALRASSINNHAFTRILRITCSVNDSAHENARPFATQKVRSDIALPSAPKRPPSGYILFLNDTRKAVMKQNPALKPTEVVKTLAEKWNMADEITKKKYETLSRERMEAFAKEKEAYTSRLTPQQKEALAELSLDKKLRVSKKKLHEKLKELDRPKGARTAFVLFSSAMRKQLQDKTPKEMMIHLATLWKQLPEDKKQPYLKQAEGDRQRYTREMQAWTKRLEDQGQRDILEDLKQDIKDIRKGKYSLEHKVKT
ncbi:transcription factor A, mitochondrial isoform X2 [Ixodes scapularis]|uniref:transcription factor A, mitochondrial isoform X2 n=1 Tax=Ixodes scapularis TaxID=6945 RepID=UPI001C3869D1|nr:transcription factor A, mitochondrial isoform X2 [Ixodes scapularis]